jgi:hypothetical protein
VVTISTGRVRLGVDENARLLEKFGSQVSEAVEFAPTVYDVSGRNTATS